MPEHRNVNVEIHNRIAKEALELVVKKPMDEGANFSDVLVILESLNLGVLIIAEQLGFRADATLQSMCDHIIDRLEKDKLAKCETKGSA